MPAWVVTNLASPSGADLNVAVAAILRGTVKTAADTISPEDVAKPVIGPSCQRERDGSCPRSHLPDL